MIGWEGAAVSTNDETLIACKGMVWPAVDSFRLPVRQNKNTCFCTVSRPTTNLNLNPS